MRRLYVHVERIVIDRADGLPPRTDRIAAALERALEAELTSAPGVRTGIERAVRAALAAPAGSRR